MTFASAIQFTAPVWGIQRYEPSQHCPKVISDGNPCDFTTVELEVCPVEVAKLGPIINPKLVVAVEEAAVVPAASAIQVRVEVVLFSIVRNPDTPEIAEATCVEVVLMVVVAVVRPTLVASVNAPVPFCGSRK